ncbi:SPRY-domain-containing protein [Teratosphaeria nubilosa]|uniref:SPRY-domain-containing protein n=1 Tax=Teratosphaeria nubilosa TaxID=161662 RepID=A0A6G1L8C4_9PEZI|nr:SPRY-domain-containing protein [Teratosphaeria nubilosa]
MSNPYDRPSSNNSSTSLPGFRRPSYATVAAAASSSGFRRGAEYAQQQQERQQQPQQTQARAERREAQPQAIMAHSRQASRGGGMEIDAPGAGYGSGTGKRASSGGPWTTPDQPQQPQEPAPFFEPSYLRRSRHVERLRQAHDEQVAEYRERMRAEPPRPAASSIHSLSAQSSHASLHKMYGGGAPTSFRSSYVQPAAVQDVIERLPPPGDEDKSQALPTRWNEEDKMNGLEILGDGTEVRFNGVTKSSDEAASIRADHPMPKECGIYYFEVTILSRGKDGLIGIGFSSKKAGLNRLPGWESESWAYHGDDGFAFACTASGKAYGPRFSSQDVVGCGINFRTGSAFFTRNGQYLGTAFTGVTKAEREGRSERERLLYPSVGVKKPSEHLKVNFGKQPFVFDIDDMMEQERKMVLGEIRKTDVANLHQPDTEPELIQKLIGQYLAHEGYVDTAKAFARDVHEKQQSVSASPQQFRAPETDDDIHAINRQKIRKSILDGDIDRALKYSNTYFPRVLEDERNRDICFQLKCRKFIEMMRRYAEMVDATSTGSPSLARSVESLGSNGHASVEANGQAGEQQQQDTQMDVDEQLHREASAAPPSKTADLDPSITNNDDVDMDASIQSLPEQKLSLMKKNELLDAALSYGQELKHEFGSDPRQSVKKSLQDLFAILAYPHPLESPVAGLLDPRGRVEVSEGVNGAILVSSGKPSSAALEKLCAQTEILIEETAGKAGGAAAFVNVRRDFLEP